MAVLRHTKTLLMLEESPSGSIRVEFAPILFAQTKKEFFVTAVVHSTISSVSTRILEHTLIWVPPMKLGTVPTVLFPLISPIRSSRNLLWKISMPVYSRRFQVLLTVCEIVFPKRYARSIRNKVLDLQALLLMDSSNVVVIVKTWLDHNYQDFELKLEGYNIFRKDRCNRRGGGVLLAIRNDISCIHRSDLEVKLEMIALEIRPNPTICVLLSAFFRPPDADELFLSQFREFLVKHSGTRLSNQSCCNWGL